MHPLFRLVRIGNTTVSFAGTIVAGLAAFGHGFAVPFATATTIGLAAASTALVTAGGNVLNDLGDRETDRVNHPDRPLVTGAVSVRGARRLATGLLVSSAVVVAPVVLMVPLLAIVLAAALGALLAYELRFKSRGLSGNALVAALTGLVFLYGGAAGGNPVVVLPLAAMAFFATLSREVIKDMEDVSGDIDRTTFPRTHGIPAASGLARGSVAVAILLSPIPLLVTVPWTSAAGIIYLGLVAATDALFVASVAWLPHELHREQTMSKAAMALALAAFLTLAFR